MHAQAGNDLNRQYRKPSAYRHPTIHSLKAFLQGLVDNKRNIFLYCDLHGHSIKRNVFCYGCDLKHRDKDKQPKASACDNTADIATWWTRFSHPQLPVLFPYLLHQRSAAFSLPDCRFHIKKSKEGTSRVVAFREFGIDLAYTLEASFMGSKDSDEHYTSRDFEAVGHDWCRALLDLRASFHEPDMAKSQLRFEV